MQQELQRAILSLRPSYPFGVAKALLRASEPRLVCFIGILNQASKELLIAAIEKGMKLKLEQVHIVDLSEQEISFDQLVRKYRAKSYLCLGKGVIEQLKIEQFDSEQRWQTISASGISVDLLISIDLAQALIEPQSKRLFWEDLKETMVRN